MDGELKLPLVMHPCEEPDSILGLYRDNGKENGNYYNGVHMDYRVYGGGCPNYGPFLDPYFSTAPNI